MRYIITVSSASKFTFTLFGILICIVILTSYTQFAYSQSPDTVFCEGWESGPNGWFANQGVWEAGIPTFGPPSPYSGQNCAGTVLGGNYPPGADTRWESPIGNPISLPSLTTGEVLQLRFWHWFSTYAEDPGVVQISVNGGDWRTISNTINNLCGGVWTQYIIDLSAYADSTIRLGFQFNSNGSFERPGWYVDDVKIIKKTIPTLANPENFELGIGDWYANKGGWEVGPPTFGPANAHSGQNCAGIVLGGNYYPVANTRLISPETTLPNLAPGEVLQLRFWHWFSTYAEDPGVVQISVDGGLWQTISNTFNNLSGGVWSHYIADISAFADSTVRFALYFSSNGSFERPGWYVDDLSIIKGEFTMPVPENFELGISDWYADKGVWEVGSPSTGPGSAFQGQNCAGTVLDGNYPPVADTRLISPKITLTPLPGQIPVLCFWHWFSTYTEDPGRVQISVSERSWQTISDTFSGISGAWTQYCVDLSAYTDSTVQLAFYFTSNGSFERPGWYVDSLQIMNIITGISETEDAIPKDFFLQQNFPNPFNPITSIRYQLPKSGKVELTIYNMLGQEVWKLVDENQAAGQYTVQWDGRDYSGRTAASGVYLYRLKAGKFIETKKMLLLR